MQPGLEIRNQAGVCEAVSLGALSAHKSIRRVCKPSGFVLQGPLGLAPLLSLGVVTRTKSIALHHLMVIIWGSPKHGPIWRAMRRDGLLQGGSLNNYLVLIKKGNASLGGAALNAEVGVMDAGPPPT